MRVLTFFVASVLLAVVIFSFTLNKRIDYLENRLLMTEAEYEILADVHANYGFLKWAKENGKNPIEMNGHDMWKADFERTQALWDAFPSGFSYPSWPSGMPNRERRYPESVKDSLPSLEAHLMRLQLLNMASNSRTESNWSEIRIVIDHLSNHQLDDYRHMGKPTRREVYNSLSPSYR